MKDRSADRTVVRGGRGRTALWFEYAGDYLLAVLLGLVFQYFAIAPMRGLGLRAGIVAAAKADILSLSAWSSASRPPRWSTSG